ncbi:MAG: transposase zinc-binding domain-containing protein, partial [Smithella sp.]
MKELLSIVGKLLYKAMGWRFEPLPTYFSNKHMIIGFPHTSNMDTVRAFTGFRIVKRTGHIMIKKEWFKWPMSMFLTAIGGITVDRRSASGVVDQMVDVFNERKEFLLAIVPEGTRKEVKTIKTGFWHIAKSANVFIICWYLDNDHKITRWLGGSARSSPATTRWQTSSGSDKSTPMWATPSPWMSTRFRKITNKPLPPSHDIRRWRQGVFHADIFHHIRGPTGSLDISFSEIPEPSAPADFNFPIPLARPVRDEHFSKQYDFWRPYIEKVIYRYLDCGDLHHGFARIRCKNCGHEYLLAFSCKRRHFCPSCHQKRVVEFGEWLCLDVLKKVPHRHFIFSIPKILRRYFLYDRKLLAGLSRCAWESLKVFMQHAVPEKEPLPGAVIAVQTFGDALGFNPHCHILVTDGCFYGKRGMFRVAPPLELKKLAAMCSHIPNRGEQ